MEILESNQFQFTYYTEFPFQNNVVVKFLKILVRK